VSFRKGVDIMEANLIEKARRLLNANYASTTLSTVSLDYQVNVAVISILEMIDDDTIICARFGADKTYANLLETRKGVFLVLLIDDSKGKDGIRVYVELEQDLTEGEYYERIKQRWLRSKYSYFPLKNCLVFKIVNILPVTMLHK
jgi:hypothetical protein